MSAYIIRLFEDPDEKDQAFSKTQIEIGDLKFEAANPGLWGEGLCVEINFNIPQQAAEGYQLDIDKMFNLVIIKTDDNGKKISSEGYLNLIIEELAVMHPNYMNRLDIALQHHSTLMNYKAGEDLPADLSSVKKLVKNGVVSYSVKESIQSLQTKINELKEDEKDQKKTLAKELTALQSSDGVQLSADCFGGADNEQKKKGSMRLKNLSLKFSI